MQAQAQRYFDLGGSTTSEGWAFLTDLNQTFVARNLSLGVSAQFVIGDQVDRPVHLVTVVGIFEQHGRDNV